RLLRFDAHLRSGRHARLRDHPSPAPPPGHLRLLAPRRLVTAWALWAVAVTVVAALPAVLSPFQIVQLTVFMIYSLLALSLDLIWGFGGILSFGQAAFFGVGGYVYWIVGINSGSTTLRSWRVSLAPLGSRHCSATSRSTAGSARCILPSSR